MLFWRTFSDEELKDLNFSCLYVFGSSPEPNKRRRAYVGMTNNLRTRWRGHRGKAVNHKIRKIQEHPDGAFDNFQCGVVFRFDDFPPIMQHVVEHVLVAGFNTVKGGLNCNYFDLFTYNVMLSRKRVIKLIQALSYAYDSDQNLKFLRRLDSIAWSRV